MALCNKTIENQEWHMTWRQWLTQTRPTMAWDSQGKMSTKGFVNAIIPTRCLKIILQSGVDDSQSRQIAEAVEQKIWQVVWLSWLMDKCWPEKNSITSVEQLPKILHGIWYMKVHMMLQPAGHGWIDNMPTKIRHRIHQTATCSETSRRWLTRLLVYSAQRLQLANSANVNVTESYRQYG